MKKIILLLILLISVSLPVLSKWICFKTSLISDTLEKALSKNALILSGCYPYKNRVKETYTPVYAVDQIKKKAFDPELLVEVKPGLHRISCKYIGPKTIKSSLGRPISFVQNIEKGKIYIPVGKIKRKRWFIELKEYSDIEELNKKFVKRIRKAFKKHRKQKKKKSGRYW